MNEKGISIGEMGGRGEGTGTASRWPSSREVMEKASTLDEAVEIMRKGPRTCEYYYVIADGNAKTAVGIGATPDKFEVVRPGEAHARLPHPVQDTVLVSAGERYDLLAERVRSGWGSSTPTRPAT
jgi:Acyl-coenzyme A:6-aminopenicillanic acid acyl-transferase.